MVLPGRDVGWKPFLKALVHEWNDDDLGNVAGALTFSGVLALFPFLLFLVSLAGIVIDPAMANALIDQLARVAPREVTTILGRQLESLGRANPTGLLTVTGLAAIWAAANGVSALINALNRAYDVRETRPWWKVRLLAIATTVVAAVLSLCAGFLAVATPAIAARIGGPWETLILWLRLPFAGVLMMLVWALLYYALPDVEQEFRFITPGSVLGVVIWTATSWLFSLYVLSFGRFDVTYGALGGVIVLLLWMWISAQVVLLGAEVNAILEQLSPEGKRRGAHRLEETGVSPLPTQVPAPRSVPPPPPRVVVRTRPASLALSALLGFLAGRRVSRS